MSAESVRLQSDGVAVPMFSFAGVQRAETASAEFTGISAMQYTRERLAAV